MLPHLVFVCVSGDGEQSTGANAWVWKKRDGKRRRKGAEIETERGAKDGERARRGESGKNPAQDGGRRGQTPGARRLFSPN